MWLTHAPNYDEIGNWYRGWKSMLSETLLAHPSVKGMLIVSEK
jgi:tuftelin-interacting protein 11